MATELSSQDATATDSRWFYCHNCSHQWLKRNNSVSCPECNEGFIEEITEDLNIPPNPEIHSVLDAIRPILLVPRPGRANPEMASQGRSNRRQVSFDFSTRLLSFTIDNVMTALVNTRSTPRMTDQQLQEIPKTVITEEQVQSQTKCTVCFEDFKLNEADIRNLQCNHMFHEKCIFPWLQSNASCPVCRFKMPNASDDDDNDDIGDIAQIVSIFDAFESRPRLPRVRRIYNDSRSTSAESTNSSTSRTATRRRRASPGTSSSSSNATTSSSASSRSRSSNATGNSRAAPPSTSQLENNNGAPATAATTTRMTRSQTRQMNRNERVQQALDSIFRSSRQSNRIIHISSDSDDSLTESDSDSLVFSPPPTRRRRLNRS